MAAINARHPWSHNDHFHPWITGHLPEHRSRAVDVGCGRGELLAQLAPRFVEVHGVDIDPTMRAAAQARCAGLANVTVDEKQLHEISTPVDLVTMIAALHHLDIETTLADIRRMLNPGGRFLCVGLARPDSLRDHAWDLASIATNPVIGYVKHPWASTTGIAPPSIPVVEPRLTFDEIARALRHVMPGALIRHHLGFRHTIQWTKP